MATNGDKLREEHFAGIRLILEEIRDIKGEIRDIKKDMLDLKGEMLDLKKEAAEDRKQAAEDRHEYRETIVGIRDALVVIGKVGRRIIQTQEKHTGLLVEIRDILKSRRKNGHNGI